MKACLKETLEQIKLFPTLSVDKVDTSGGRHVKIHLSSPNGKHLYIISRSDPPDRRAILNNRSQLKRWATSIEPTKETQ